MNNGPVALTVGQDLAWNQWHSVSIQASFATLQYIGITVDGQYQSLAGVPLPAGFDFGVPVYTDYLDLLSTEVVANSFDPVSPTQDDIYWDNISAVPEPTSFGALGIGTLGILVRRKREKRSSKK